MLDDDKREILQSSDFNILPLSLDIIEEPKNNKDVSPDIQEKVINEDNGDDVISRIKAQNILLKICCLCFIVCTIVNIFIFTKKDDNFIVQVDNQNNQFIPSSTLTAAQVYNQNIESIVAIHAQVVVPTTFGNYTTISAGSGFVISHDGYILTNYHVVENSLDIEVAFADGHIYLAELIGHDADNDIAVLKLKDLDIPLQPVKMGESKKLVIGEDVVAIGNPLGELTFSITKGIVSAVNRDIKVDNFNIINMFQVDCAVNQGNSGGPIFNMAGEVIGIVSAKYASDVIEGLGFCIPIDDVTNMLSDLINHGRVLGKAYMGVSVMDVTEDMIAANNTVYGAYISAVEGGSCAEKAGLQVGDVIVKVGDTSVLNVSELLLTKRIYKAGDTVTLKIWRNREYFEVDITFDEYHAEEPTFNDPTDVD